jgi:DNA-binding NarL/FixJ family response regulator
MSQSGNGHEREVAVMTLVMQGHTDATIARRLGVSPITVHRDVQRFVRRVGGRSRLHAVLIALERGELPRPKL